MFRCHFGGEAHLEITDVARLFDVRLLIYEKGMEGRSAPLTQASIPLPADPDRLKDDAKVGRYLEGVTHAQQSNYRQKHEINEQHREEKSEHLSHCVHKYTNT